ncbi:MAG: Hsp20/alpha crystallin family protein [Aggregatilineales bacterium]
MNKITRWNPIREMATMQNVMDSFFDDQWRSLSRSDFWNNGEQGMALDVNETDDDYTIVADLPGVSADNIHINLHDGVLTINAEIPEQTIEREGERSLIRERRYGRFSRSVRLPQAVNDASVEADYDGGILKLTLPKAEEVKPKAIPVRAGNGNK